MSYPKLPFLLRPYMVWELPGWGRLYRMLGIHGVDNTSARWRTAPTRVTRGKRHGYRMRLNLADDLERQTYFLRRYYDLAVQLVLDVLLGSGDTFVDIGANIGMTTLYGAHLVGPQGQVIVFEPQPECCKRIRDAVADNGLSWVDVQDVGLSDHSSQLKLHLIGGGTILASFAIDEEIDGPSLRETIAVPVVTGDSLIPGRVSGNLAIKIDVEGWELHVLRGLVRTIDTWRPTILTEVEPRYLRRAGVDEHLLFSFLHERGYAAYAIGLRRRVLKYCLHLRPISSAEELAGQIDVLWVPTERRSLALSPHSTLRMCLDDRPYGVVTTACE